MSKLRLRIKKSGRPEGVAAMSAPPAPHGSEAELSAPAPQPARAKPMALPAGTRLNGIYEIEQRIAQGGMGEVYSGRTLATGDKVAIKMVLPEHSGDELIVGLFRKEASTLHTLYHDAIVRYYLFSVDPELERPYLVMEFAAGSSLSAHLREHGALSREALTTLRRRVADGLDAAHKIGVFHRDISPDNIILVDGDVAKAKLIDFGIAKQQNSEETLIGSSMAGKLNYMSPEQLGMNGGTVTARSDIYSLGLVLAEAASGQPLPMTGSQLDLIEKRRAVPDLASVPGHIRPLVEAMLAPEPDARPSSMADVAGWDSGMALASEPTRVLRPTPAPRRQSWTLIGGAAAALALCLATAGYVALGTFDAERVAPLTTAEPTRGRRALLAVQDEIIAPPAVVGQSYEWTTRAFAYNGRLEDMIVRPIGLVPPGLAFGHKPDGVSKLIGTPEQAGVFSFILDAESPEGLVAEQVVILQVE